MTVLYFPGDLSLAIFIIVLCAWAVYIIVKGA